MQSRDTQEGFRPVFLLLRGLRADVVSLPVNQAGFIRRTLLLSHLLVATHS